MDQDLVDGLGATPTPTEKLYAQAIQDARTAQTALTEFREVVKAQFDWFQQYGNSIPADTYSEDDRLYQRCVFTGVEIRKQAMTTTTTREIVMQDVINDGIWIGEQLYAHFKAKKGQV